MRYTLVLASDGLWTVFGPNIVLKHLSGLLGQGVMRIAKNNTTYGTGSESDSPDQLEKKKFRGKAMMALNDNGAKEEGTSLQEVCENFCKLIRKRWDEVTLL